jgi:hypothetical protein
MFGDRNLEKNMRFAVIGTSIGLLLSSPALAFGPYTDGTNPYVEAIVHLRLDDTNTKLARIESLGKKYRFSWDGHVFRKPGPNSPSTRSDDLRISLHRRDIPALSREPGVIKVEPVWAFAF